MRRNDPDGVRRRILDAGFALFVRQGCHATGMQELRAAAGVSGGAFAHHFPTKTELERAVIEERAGPAVEAAWIAPVASAPDLRAGVAAAFAGILAAMDPGRGVTGCPLNNLALDVAGRDPALREAAAAIFARWRAAIAARARADQAAGRLAALDPEAAAAFVVAAYSGAMAQARAAQDAAPVRACAAELDRWLAAAGG